MKLIIGKVGLLYYLSIDVLLGRNLICSRRSLFVYRILRYYLVYLAPEYFIRRTI
jgi:hypothetical protein